MLIVILWTAVFFITIAVLSKIPGFNLLLQPVIEILIQNLIKLGRTISIYCVWIIKSIGGAHMAIVKHLLHSKEYFDPTSKIKKKN